MPVVCYVLADYRAGVDAVEPYAAPTVSWLWHTVEK